VINLFLKYKSKSFESKELSHQDIKNANKILFCLFTRYGDTIISLCVINEFIRKHPKKDYLILCPEQMGPFVEEILPRIRFIKVNKRNLFKMLVVNNLLKKWFPDIAFSPWSNGLDSCFFSSYAKKYFCYRDFSKPSEVNHYDVIRKYLLLEQKPFHLIKKKPEEMPNSFLICPDSTDKKRSLDDSEVQKLVEKINLLNANALITCASMKEINFNGGANFIFKKNSFSSRGFISLVKSTDVIIAVDSAPLHIAIALKKDTVPIFKSTNPKNVINSHSEIVTGLI